MCRHAMRSTVLMNENHMYSYAGIIIVRYIQSRIMLHSMCDEMICKTTQWGCALLRFYKVTREKQNYQFPEVLVHVRV